MLFNPILRLTLGLPAAALIVFGLFQFMSAMIEDDVEWPDEVAQKVITAIPRPEVDETRPRQADRQIKKVDLAAPPPAMRRFSASTSDINLPNPAFTGAAPAKLDAGPLKAMALDPVIVPDRRAQPLTPPSISYPAKLAARGIEGQCDVLFDVGLKGQPFNVKATCSHPGFAREAERAVRRVMFAPEVQGGQARARRNVVYPIEFKLNES